MSDDHDRGEENSAWESFQDDYRKWESEPFSPKTIAAIYVGYTILFIVVVVTCIY